MNTFEEQRKIQISLHRKKNRNRKAFYNYKIAIIKNKKPTFLDSKYEIAII